MLIRCVIAAALVSSAGCSKILGFSEAKHGDAGVDDATVSDSTIADTPDAPSGPVTCKFDDPASTFDGTCLLGN